MDILSENKNVAVIGAGLGGLAVSCLLAAQGHSVTVFEKNDQPGGKINEILSNGFRFDTGPSLLTMPKILRYLFSRCGTSLERHLKLRPLAPICRYNYPDGTTFDCHQEIDKTLAEIKRIAPNDVENFTNFLTYSAMLFERTKEAFLSNPLYSWEDVINLNCTDLLKIDAFKTVAERVDREFESEYLRKFFKRFTTYNGSSPYQGPATLNVIPHVELSLGGYYIDGGMYRLVDALKTIAQNAGVRFHFNALVKRIEVQDGRASALILEYGESFTADIIISNSDASETYLNLLSDEDISSRKKRSVRSLEPSCSGFVLLLGINKKYEQLRHHNIFFSDDYRREFNQIFRKKVMPDDPTIYIADTSRSNPMHAPDGGSNLFVLVNAPYLSDQWHWEKNQEKYGNKIINQLETKGLTDLHKSIIYRKSITPVDFFQRYRSNKGSIYGTSSNSKMAAFMRPKNKARSVDGLYLTGGSTHPGGGIPLVILSAFHAAELINRYE